MKIQFFSIKLCCLLAGLSFAPVTSKAEPPALRPTAPSVKPPAVKPPSVPAVKPATPSAVKPPSEITPVIEDRRAEPKTSSHSAKPSSRPSTEANLEATKSKLITDPEVKALMEREKIAIESDAMKGLLTEHSAFDASLGLRKEPTQKTSAIFETNLAKRLVGDERFENKDLKLDDIKDLQALTCKNGKDGQGGCGHSKFNLSCRRISGFLAAASAASLSVPIGAAFYSFLKAEPNKKGDTIEVPGVTKTEDGKEGSLVIKDLDKPVAGEEITPARESK